MRLAFMGTPDFSVAALDQLARAGHDIVRVYTQPPRPAGRGKKLQKSAVHLAADRLGLSVETPKSFKDPDVIADFAVLDLDIAVVVAFGQILPQAVLDAPARGCLNIHASLLPRWRGAAPIHRAIMAGDTETGVCIMQMEAGLDTGPVLLRDRVEITPIMTTPRLHSLLADMGGRLIVDTLDQIDDLVPQQQADEGVTYAKKITKAEGLIDWRQDASAIDRQVRALQPFPGAFGMLGGERLKILAGEVMPIKGDQSGEILDADRGIVACGTGSYRIMRLQRSGKGAMDWADFQRGFAAENGMVFVAPESGKDAV